MHRAKIRDLVHMNVPRHKPPQISLPTRRNLLAYVWIVVKNVIGWALILGAGPIGVLIPGPGGLPLFLIGFALVTFPGKRNLTARVLRGKPIRRESRAYRITLLIVALLAPAGFISWLIGKWWPNIDGKLSVPLTIIYVAGAMLIWAGGYHGYEAINVLLALVAKGRRRVRPWLRARGLDLLPPRRRRRLRPHDYAEEPDVGIMEIHARHRERMVRLWQLYRGWLLALLGGVVALAIVLMRIWARPRS
jgi:hypothetical protein